MLSSTKIVIFLFIALFTAGLPAQEEVPVPELRMMVTDLTGTLSASRIKALEGKLRAFEKKKGSQIAVLIVPETRPETIAQYSIRVAEKWKLGRKGIDDGVLLLIAKNERKLRIEVGYGLEGALTDSLTKQIIDDIIVPRFKKGDFEGGIDAGIDGIITVLAGEPLPEPEVKIGGKRGRFRGGFIALLFVFLIVGAVLRGITGRFWGGALTGILAAVAAFFILGSLLKAVLMAAVAFGWTAMAGRGGGGLFYGAGMMGMMGGGFGGGSSGGFGGFSGGGGGFGGGGSSGGW